MTSYDFRLPAPIYACPKCQRTTADPKHVAAKRCPFCDLFAQVYTCPKCRMSTADPTDVARKHCPFCEIFDKEAWRNEGIPELAAFPDCRHLTKRQCFSVAGLALLHFGGPDARLVHGWARNSFAPEYIQHAWIETPGIGHFEDDVTGETMQQPITVVIDLTQRDEPARHQPRTQYYEALGVRTVPPPKRFTLEQMVREAYKHGHDGPWE